MIMKLRHRVQMLTPVHWFLPNYNPCTKKQVAILRLRPVVAMFLLGLGASMNLFIFFFRLTARKHHLMSAGQTFELKVHSPPAAPPLLSAARVLFFITKCRLTVHPIIPPHAPLKICLILLRAAYHNTVRTQKGGSLCHTYLRKG